ncbi:hypothetical protein, partial [Sphingobacterium sp.]|uniref:hypothetical protein n=1 Tax=Sphingobacterium sp. TaxID=341027 RepID=UPI0028AB365C
AVSNIKILYLTQFTLHPLRPITNCELLLIDSSHPALRTISAEFRIYIYVDFSDRQHNAVNWNPAEHVF